MPSYHTKALTQHCSFNTAVVLPCAGLILISTEWQIYQQHTIGANLLPPLIGVRITILFLLTLLNSGMVSRCAAIPTTHSTIGTLSHLCTFRPLQWLAFT